MSARAPIPAPYRCYPDFLDDETARALVDFAISREHDFTTARLYDGKVDTAQRTSLGISDFGRLQELLTARVRAMVPQLASDLRLTPFEPRHIETGLAAHCDGGFFRRHLDTRIGSLADPRSTRAISAVYYFHREPKAFTGGALRLHHFDGRVADGDFVDVEPVHNMLVAFPSWVVHEVLPVSCPSRQFRDARFSVNCWVHRAN